MTIPTPASFAQHLKERKQHETQLAVEEKERAKIGSSHSSSAKVHGSAQSRSSQKDKAPGTSLKSETEEAVSIPTNSTAPSTSPSAAPKKAFVRKPHLTERPLLHHEGLQKLRDSLPQNHKQNHKGGRPPKHTGSTSKKK